MSAWQVIRNSKAEGALKLILGGVLAGIATKLALGGAAEYGYGLGAEATAKSVAKFADEAMKRGLSEEDIDECFKATKD